jgi:hypothetical protein
MSLDTILMIEDAIRALGLRDLDVRITVKEGVIKVEEYINYWKRD